jgi:hypothetical protein
MKISGYHEGDRSELLAHSILSAVAHVVPVPRIADYFGIDLFAQPFSKEGRNLRTGGSTFCMQLKSTAEEIPLNSPEDLLILNGLANPLFMGVVDKSSRTLSIFTTILRFPALLDDSKHPIVLYVDGSGPGISFNEDEPTIVRCGPPICIARQDDLDSADVRIKESARKTLSDCLAHWVRLEALALAWRTAGIPAAPTGPADWAPGEVPDHSTTIALSWKPVSIAPLVKAAENIAFALHTACTNVPISPGFSQEEANLFKKFEAHAQNHLQAMIGLRREVDPSHVWD